MTKTALSSFFNDAVFSVLWRALPACSHLCFASVCFLSLTQIKIAALLRWLTGSCQMLEMHRDANDSSQEKDALLLVLFFQNGKKYRGWCVSHRKLL